MLTLLQATRGKRVIFDVKVLPERVIRETLRRAKPVAPARTPLTLRAHDLLAREPHVPTLNANVYRALDYTFHAQTKDGTHRVQVRRERPELRLHPSP